MGRAGWERWLAFRCTGCGNCCKGTYICLTDGDARRLAEGTGRPLEEFVRFAHEDEFTMSKRHGWWVRFRRRRGIMVLRWRRGRCVFLDAADRCTAYAHRPIVCRTHPFDITLTDGTGGGVEKLSINRLTPCPHELDGHQTRRELGLLERLHWRESLRYCDKVSAWNRRFRGRPAGTFGEFLRHVVLGPPASDTAADDVQPRARAG